VELVPLLFTRNTNEPIAGLKPLPALELEGRDIYIREGCNNCHSQMIRPLRAETERYGHYSVAGEFVYDHPFLWGSKRTGPDLARVGKRYSDDWHRAHLYNPRDVVPESNMPAFTGCSTTRSMPVRSRPRCGRCAPWVFLTAMPRSRRRRRPCRADRKPMPWSRTCSNSAQ
jgi:cbb3-type cytochrome c oxidase subunit II